MQQWGLLYTTPGKSGFLTSLYIILVPMAGLLFGRRVKPWVWGGSVVLAVLGLYLLCGSTDFSLGAGELLTLGSAVAFCFHILVIDRASSQVDGVRLSATQFFICAVSPWSAPSVGDPPLGKHPRLLDSHRLWPVSSPVYWLYLPDYRPGLHRAHRGLLLMSLESVFSVIFGSDHFTSVPDTHELLGCALVFAGVLISQIPGKAPAPKAQEKPLSIAPLLMQRGVIFTFHPAWPGRLPR